MKRIDSLLMDYGSSHRTLGNLACHALGITLILFGVFSMLATIPLAGGWTVSEAVVGVAFLVYAALDVPVALGVLGYEAILDLAARAVANWRVGAAAFVAGWIFQAIGHAVYEKNRPAFFRNLVHLLIGPAYLVVEALGLRRAAR
jgi:uncharacterized membrane protein YGL010W